MLGDTARWAPRELRINFLPSQTMPLLANIASHEPSRGSFRFYPPDCYQLSQARTLSLLRSHLPPHIVSFGLESPLVPPYLVHQNNVRLPRLRQVPCEQPHPQSRHGSDQVSGFTLFRTLTHPQRRSRFARAVCRSLPIASFRPHRYQRRPCDSDCLPLGRGDACVFQQAGFARHAGQTKRQSQLCPCPYSLNIGYFLKS